MLESKGTVEQMRCICRHKPLLAVCGNDDDGVFIHVKVYKQSRLYAELFSSMAGVRMTHVAYKGSGTAITDLIASMDGHLGDVSALAISTDGATIFSGARDNTIRAWDYKRHHLIREIKDQNNLA